MRNVFKRKNGLYSFRGDTTIDYISTFSVLAKRNPNEQANKRTLTVGMYSINNTKLFSFDL